MLLDFEYKELILVIKFPSLIFKIEDVNKKHIEYRIIISNEVLLL